jgi:Ran GTPase-activating protein (RanGAP) involved in mRNA processing and transport
MPISKKLLYDIERNVISDEFISLIPYTEDAVLCDEDVIKLAGALKENKFIKKINLHGNDIGDQGIVELFEKVKNLEELELSNGLCGYTDYYNNITEIGAKALAQSKLKKLVLSCNPNIGNGGIIALSKNRTIIDLDVRGCGITAEGAKKLFRANCKIKKLSLEGNRIGDEGLSTLSQNHSIQELDISGCYVTESGAEFIAENTSITKLFLKDNKIGRGISVLTRNKKLSHLDLTRCEIDSSNVITAIQSNNVLLYLNLEGNSIDPDVLQILKEQNYGIDGFVFTRTKTDIMNYCLKKSSNAQPFTVPDSDYLLAPTSMFFTKKRGLTDPLQQTSQEEKVPDSPPQKTAKKSEIFEHIPPPEKPSKLSNT